MDAARATAAGANHRDTGPRRVFPSLAALLWPVPAGTAGWSASESPSSVGSFPAAAGSLGPLPARSGVPRPRGGRLRFGPAPPSGSPSAVRRLGAAASPGPEPDREGRP